MKKKLISIIVLNLFIACQSNPQKPSVADSSSAAVGEKDSMKKDEDCDDKAKKTVEIKEETISLTGNTGCSLDETNLNP